VYREKLTLPKLIVNGANDPYWSQDALNLYWDDLKGDKWILYVPNAGHGLDQTYEDGKKDRNRVLGTLAMFSHCQVMGKEMPKLSWKHDDAGAQMKIAVSCSATPKAVRLWVADAPTRDFRKAKWTATDVTPEKNAIGLVDKPKEGWRTFFAEYELDNDGVPYYLSTQLRMCEAGK
jgi:PhoPQ-activated pathogenicity-related protein